MNLIPSRVDYTFEIAIRSTPTAASNTQKRRRLSKFLKPSARWESQALAEFQFLLDFANRTRGGIALSVLQHDHILALEHWLKLLDLVNVDDYRAVDAKESLRGEMGFQRTHGLAQDMILLADMHYRVFSGGLDG